MIANSFGGYSGPVSVIRFAKYRKLPIENILALNVLVFITAQSSVRRILRAAKKLIRSAAIKGCVSVRRSLVVRGGRSLPLYLWKDASRYCWQSILSRPYLIGELQATRCCNYCVKQVRRNGG